MKNVAGHVLSALRLVPRHRAGNLEPGRPSLPRLGALSGVVAVGGGTGLGRTLCALSFLGERLTGVVTTTDNGGSTGWIREQAGGIAWGDIRNCLNQVVDQPTLGSLLFEHRFVESGELTGHSLGNLILLALDQLSPRPLHAIDLIREMLGVRLRLVPMSEGESHLASRYSDGRPVRGEVHLDAMTEVPRAVWLDPPVPATPEALRAVAEADLILFGPGSHMTSILPALLLPDFREAVARSRAVRVLIGNLRAERGPVGRLDLAELLQWSERVLGQQLFDMVLWPASRRMPDQEGVYTVVADVAGHAYGTLHDPGLLAQAIERCLESPGETGSLNATPRPVRELDRVDRIHWSQLLRTPSQRG